MTRALAVTTRPGGCVVFRGRREISAPLSASQRCGHSLRGPRQHRPLGIGSAASLSGARWRAREVVVNDTAAPVAH